MIVVKDVKKQFEGKQVINGVSFHITPFESVGIIGKNGAGKTTLLKLISGVLKEDSGFIRINACRDILSNIPMLKKMSYVSGTRTQLWGDMKLVYSFENCGKMYRISKGEYEERLKELVTFFDIENCLNKPVTQLSLGQKMRAELVYAFLPKPEILLLDEAMIGLDVSIKEKVMNALEKLKEERKTTIVYTSHNLTEIEKLCDRVLLLDQGKIIFDGTVEEIQSESAPEYQIDIELQEKIPDLEDLPIEKYILDKNSLSIRFNKQKVETATVIKHIISRCGIKNVKITEPNLEETIKNIYRRNSGND